MKISDKFSHDPNRLPSTLPPGRWSSAELHLPARRDDWRWHEAARRDPMSWVDPFTRDAERRTLHGLKEWFESNLLRFETPTRRRTQCIEQLNISLLQLVQCIVKTDVTMDWIETIFTDMTIDVTLIFTDLTTGPDPRTFTGMTTDPDSTICTILSTLTLTMTIRRMDARHNRLILSQRIICSLFIQF